METKCGFVNEEKVKKVREKQIETADIEKMADIFSALSEPTRLKILLAISIEELCVCDIASLLDLTQSNVSHQLSLLKKLRLVSSRKEKRHVYYRLADEHIVNLMKECFTHVIE